MSNSSSNDYFILLLDDILVELNRYVGILILLFSIIGNVLNILVLSQSFFRTNSCAWIFLAASIVNLVSILSGLITRITSSWFVDPTLYLGWACKLRAHLVFSTRTAALWLIALATIDRWLLSSIQVHRRQKSNLHNSQKSTIIIIILSHVLYSQMFYCYEANLMHTPTPCYGKTIVCRYVTDLSFSFVTILSPLFIMILFGALTVSNMRESQRRVQALSVRNTLDTLFKPSQSTSGNPQRKLSRKRDRSLLRMLFVQILLILIFAMPLAIDQLYLSLRRETGTAKDKAINEFIYQLVVLAYFISNGMPFYIYTLSGGILFRKALSDFFISMKRIVMH